ncbi:aminoglycoside phosphotransferase family protein [Shewanella baltica]|uniref:aminoglycoside phosphotransferase family protein n=1 Tax=Shewanella baltica TaxID=62322 RepID=UPI00217DB65B|nr:aminoglycoside phosphotransferase family protein [Shewanella baltica]MCS6208166.1 aminoglycoside phosphotransferase family protein [Shewanella baltica]
MLDVNAAKPYSAGESFNALLPILKRAGLEQVLSICELSGGLSNHNYKITTPVGCYVLRVNADAADSFCTRQQERFYWQQLAQAQLAPALLWVSDDERYYLSDFIESDLIESDFIESGLIESAVASVAEWAAIEHNVIDSERFQRKRLIHWPALERQTSAADFVLGQSSLGILYHGYSQQAYLNPEPWLMPLQQDKHPNSAARLLLELLLQLRELPTGPYAISITEQWQEYHQQMLAYQASLALTHDWSERVAKLLNIQIDIKHWCDDLAACLIKPQFCHRDLNSHNLLLKNNRLYCIDFEYATASHPLCELAVVLATHALTPAQQNELVTQYLSEHPYVTAHAVAAVPAAIDMYWVFACYWALLMAAQTEPSRSADYLAWFDCFWPLITQAS